MAEAFCPMCEMRIMTMATSIFTGMIGKRKASHVWKSFGQMTTTILANNLSFDLLPLSEIRTKSKKMAWLPEPRSDLVSSSITSMLCVVWSRPLGKVRCRSPTTSKKFCICYLCGRTKSAIHFNASITTPRALVGTKWKEAEPFDESNIISFPKEDKR
jgi:hypothetical protein